MKKTKFVVLKNYYLLFFFLLISVVFILGMGVTQAQAAKKTDAQKGGAAGLVDINRASEKELEAIKGVGPVKAKKIIAGRPYKSVDELSKAGISAKTILSMKPSVTVGATLSKTRSTGAAKLAPGTKININTAERATLEKLPEIGPVKAKAIVEGRPYKSVEDIMKVSGIKGKTFDAIKDFIVVR